MISRLRLPTGCRAEVYRTVQRGSPSGPNGALSDTLVRIYKSIEFLFVRKEKGTYLIDFRVCFPVNERIRIFGTVRHDCFRI